MSLVLNGTTGASKVQDNSVPPEALTFGIVGQVIFGGWSVAPAGYLKCNGAAISRATYSALFTAIGTTFGVGDGSTTFNLPDLRGEFIRGLDDGRGIDSGRALGSAQVDDLKSHSHNIPLYGNIAAVTTVVASSGSSLSSTGATSASGGTETRPRNIALLAVIKY